ncbi:class I SAM-dependent rRNA methyltransferase [Shouchella patagoniensis]|uniref:class I SAM-dependent rRNA methyltransferase n=1 Tax=Shouchella patagoniensis TaxID=228576 RepID=UPI0009953FA3
MKTNEMVIHVDERTANKLKGGYPLLDKEYVKINDAEEGVLLHIKDRSGRFVARGYYGKQNVGNGWVLTTNEQEGINQAFFQKKIAAALNKRQALFASEETTAFRVFNGEGDGVGGLTIDYYDGFFVITWYSAGMYAFHKAIVAALTESIAYKGVYEKKRFATDGKYVDDDDFVCGERGEFPLIIKENGMFYAVYLNDGPMTGIFLDQRNVRRRIRDSYASGKRVLNLFSYTGAFSIAAALGGAAQTTSVDLANRSKPKTEEQFLINNILVEDQRIIVMDAFRYFAYAQKKGIEFDLVVLDPPSFARSKKRTFSAAKDYTGLLQEAISVVPDGGCIIASTNAANVAPKQFKKFIHDAFQAENRGFKIIEEHGVPEDFVTTAAYPKGSYLKVLMIQVTKKG